jgi:hypothetical protein
MASEHCRVVHRLCSSGHVSGGRGVPYQLLDAALDGLQLQCVLPQRLLVHHSPLVPTILGLQAVKQGGAKGQRRCSEDAENFERYKCMTIEVDRVEVGCGVWGVGCGGWGVGGVGCGVWGGGWGWRLQP